MSRVSRIVRSTVLAVASAVLVASCSGAPPSPGTTSPPPDQIGFDQALHDELAAMRKADQAALTCSSVRCDCCAKPYERTKPHPAI